MKQNLFLKLLVLVTCLSSALSVSAHDFAVDGICYNILSSTDQTVEVTRHGHFGSEYYTGYGNVIPSTVTYVGKTWTVVAIGDSAFYRSSTTAGAMLDLTMPNTITRIGKAAFYLQTDLTSLTLSSNLKTIDDDAFNRCSGLTSMTIPNGVTTIGIDAFAYCSGLSSVTIPNSVTVIKSWAFYHCNGLTSITIPNSVTSLGVSVFNGCSNLKSVTIGSGLTIIPNSAFNYCSSLKTVSIPNSVTLIDNWAFGNCTALESISIGSNVTSINYAAFNGCASLSEVVIPDKVTTIENTAFQNCTSLTKFTIGKSVTSIGSYALDFGGSVPYYSETALPARDIYCRSTVPPTIQSNTFGNTDGVSYLFNPYLCYTVYVHGPYSQSLYSAAPYWSNFSTIPSTSHIRPEQRYDFLVNGIYYLISGSNTAKVTNKNGGTLSNDNITSYTGHVTIPNTAYDDYTSKTYNVTAIGTHAFDETRVANLNSTGEAPSLRGTQGDLKSVTVGNNVTTIEEYAFTNATGLACVSLGSGVTSIGNYAFNGCSALTSVFSRRTTPPTITSSTFDNSHYSTATVYVPTAAAVTNYKAANYWRNFTNIKVIPTLNEALNVSGGTINFTSTGSYPWMVMADGGGLYAQSGNYGIHSSSSTLTATVTVPTGGASLTFDFKAWGEGSNSYIYDKCIFSVDGTQQYSYGARDNDWETYTVQLTAGTHTLTWTYSKDGSINPIGDFFAVRNVKLNVEAYAYWSQMLPNFLYFYCDGLRSARTGIHPNGYQQVTFDLNEGTNIPAWINFAYAGNINYVAFDASFANARPTSTYQWFAGMPIISYDGFLSNLNTENVTNMSFMFSGCASLSSLDLSNFNTSNVTDMSYMFAQCANLTSLDVSSFNTSKVTSMRSMFASCTGLTSLDLSSFNTSNVTNMWSMFDGCTGLRNLDLSHFNTANVTTLYYMFGNCSNLTSLDLSSFNTAKVTSMGYMFYGCSNLKTIYAGSGWTTNAVTYSPYMFRNCTSLVGGKGTTYNSSYVDAGYAHIDGGPSNPGYFTDINASQAGDVNGDGQVTIADVTELIDSLLSGLEVPTHVADVNGDGQVTIADVTELIDMLLGS